jgi:hypothetical protein
MEFEGKVLVGKRGSKWIMQVFLEGQTVECLELICSSLE